MTWNVLLYVFFLGLALSADAFAVSVADGLVYRDIDKKKSFFIAGTFGFMQAAMPLIGFWLIELIEYIVMQAETAVEGAEKAAQAGAIMSTVVAITAAVLLVFIGAKMLIESLLEMKKPKEEKESKSFTIKETLLFGIATSIDALAAGVAMHADVSTNVTIWLHVSIILVLTFGTSLLGLFFGKQITKLLKGRYEVAGIIGGIILLLLAVWVLLSHFLGL